MRKACLPPLRTRRCLLLPYQVLASVSRSCPSRMGRFPTCYSPVRHSPPKWFVRLACIRHAASVHPEPGSNSPFDIDSFSLFLFFFLFRCLSRNRRDFFSLVLVRFLFHFYQVFKDRPLGCFFQQLVYTTSHFLFSQEEILFFFFFLKRKEALSSTLTYNTSSPLNCQLLF